MSRNRQLTDKIRAALNAGNLTTSGISSSAITVHSGANANSLLSADASGYADGSLHYSTNDKKLFVYDDSENKFYEISTSNFLGYVPPYQGSNYGYVEGGSYTNIIERYSFTADGNATDTADLDATNRYTSGISSSSHGYTVAGQGGGDKIRKRSFATESNSAQVASLTTAANYQPQMATEGNTGFVAGTNTTMIQKFPFASDDNSTDTGGDMYGAVSNASWSTSTTHGYIAGGNTPFGWGGPIVKYPFAISSGTTSDVGNTIGNTRPASAGTQSDTHGYIHGQYLQPGNQASNRIEKYSFTSDGNSTDVGDQTSGANNRTGSSSTTHGYAANGNPTGGEIIEKYSFASDGNSTDVGDCISGRFGVGANQY
jgi:hypothetical protein